MNQKSLLGLPLLLALLAACANQPTTVVSGDPCDTGVFTILDDFPGARRGDCEILGSREVRLHIVREDDKVKNSSPWYAFKLVATEKTSVGITLDYGDWPHRYVPKISVDGKHFQPAPAAMFNSPTDHELQLSLNVGVEPIWIAAQQLLTPSDYENWLGELAGQSGTALSTAGRSTADLPILKLESGADKEKVILLTGRQHPPEVSGAVGMMAFLDTLYGESLLAAQFRQQFRVISLPLMNPDGVVAGHWRHNLGATDLNRDWGSFSQPETQVVKDLLDRLESEQANIVAFVDFHSMNRSLVYSQAEPTSPEGFTAIWLARAMASILGDAGIDYPFENEPRPTSATANGKNYMYKRYGIPSMTFEVGDEIAYADNVAAAGIFAEEFMRLALERL